MDTYSELMARHAMLEAAWMQRVAEDKAGTREAFQGAGIVLRRDGTLEITAYPYDRGTGARPLWGLLAAPGDTEVTVID